MPTRSGHPGPTLSYDEVMAIPLDDPGTGKPVKVGQCHAPLFRHVLFAACERHPACQDLKEQLRGLLFQYMPDRWHAVNLLAQYGVEFPGKQNKQRMTLDG